jgi:hypothetical protein
MISISVPNTFHHPYLVGNKIHRTIKVELTIIESGVVNPTKKKGIKRTPITINNKMYA